MDGVRLDAVPYLCERGGTNCENLPETCEFLRSMRRYVDGKHKDRVLLAEANQWPEDIAYLLDKATHELGYELNNRPEWIMIPVRGTGYFLWGK
ncbi:MAG: hypothetical protein LLF99_15095 [Desulfobacteraceae bacterium]|nr:hypothetical protein [Desulfobacteraceae bacterium]